MKKSTSVVIGLVLTAGIGLACAEGDPDQEFMDMEADHQQMCVTIVDEGQNLLRGEDSNCAHQPEDNGGGGTFVCTWCWYYLGRVHGTPPAVGQKIPIGSSGSFVRPSTGTIAKPPASGGFGVTKVSVGS